MLSVLSVQFLTKTRSYNFINELLSLGDLLIRSHAAAIVSAQGLGSPSISSDALEISVKNRFKEHVSTSFSKIYIFIYNSLVYI